MTTVLAYVKKVNGLLGHVSGRTPTNTVLAAFEAGVSAERFSAQIASLEPVGKCIQPMKIDAVNEMEKHTRERIAKLLEGLEAADGDMHVAFPKPEYR